MKKRSNKKLSSDPRDLSHELRAVPEVAGAARDAQNGWMASISRPFWVRFGDFEFPAALAQFSGGNVPMWHCATVAMCHRHTRGGWRVVAGGGRFRAKVWSHWILLLSQAHTQDRYPAAAGGQVDSCNRLNGLWWAPHGE